MYMNLYTDARLILPDRILPGGFLLEQDGRILETGPAGFEPSGNMQRISCGGLYLSPGFVDLHSHGGGGYDFMDGMEEAIYCAVRTHLLHGTTTLLPTTQTSSDDELFRTIDLFKAVKKHGATIPCLPGLHLEGPYFHRAQLGAQNPKHIRNPSPEHYEKILERAEGTVLRWSVAPELEGALEMGRRLSAEGILMSIGHSNADYDQVLAAVENGYTHVTHFYSGMSGIVRRGGFRILGVIESAYLLDNLSVELIADGLHLPPPLLKMICKCKDTEKICLVTDSMRGAGQAEGPSIIGSFHDGQPVIIEDGIAKMPDRSCFAGSVATSDRLVRTMTQQVGLTLEKAVSMMTRIPAHIAGLSKKGSLLPGKDADFLLFDDDIRIQKVFVAGKLVDPE
jgi:N-acetylglucosamine-6-phosphate deacetylase